MNKPVLILYSREGCCICKSLETRLRSIALESLHPPLKLLVVDIDAPDFPESERARYDLEVPVMLLGDLALTHMIPFPRVSPRLNDAALFQWLQKVLTKKLQSD